MTYHDDMPVLSTNGPASALSDGLPSHSPEIEARLGALHDVFRGLLETERNAGANILLSRINRLLSQFHLSSFYTESEILIEAYLRTHFKVANGRIISNIPGWLYRVSFNIIREYSRARRRDRLLVERNSFERGQAQQTAEPPDFMNERSVALLHNTLLQLSVRDRDLLFLRIGKSLSWREVSKEMYSLHLTSTSEATLRQQGKRALSRLKRAFVANEKSATPSTDGGSEL